MRKSTKGALAGAAAAVLLMGGFGTHAAWQDEAAVPGGDINTGHLYLSSSCGDWDLVNTALSVSDTVLQAELADLRMIPGDVLSKLCSFTVHIEGDNLVAADLTLSGNPEVVDGTDPLAELTDFTAAAEFTDENGDAIDDTVNLSDGDVVNARLTVQLASGLTGLQGQDLAGVLEGLTVSVTQA